MDEKIWDAVVPVLRQQRGTGKWATLDECIERARAHGVRVDLVILLVRHELPMARPDRRGVFPRFVVDVAETSRGGVYIDDHEMLEALHLAAEALGKTIRVQVIERLEPTGGRS